MRQVIRFSRSRYRARCERRGYDAGEDVLIDVIRVVPLDKAVLRVRNWPHVTNCRTHLVQICHALHKDVDIVVSGVYIIVVCEKRLITSERDLREALGHVAN